MSRKNRIVARVIAKAMMREQALGELDIEELIEELLNAYYKNESTTPNKNESTTAIGESHKELNA